jgi:hypothetical protein
MTFSHRRRQSSLPFTIKTSYARHRSILISRVNIKLKPTIVPNQAARTVVHLFIITRKFLQNSRKTLLFFFSGRRDRTGTMMMRTCERLCYSSTNSSQRIRSPAIIADILLNTLRTILDMQFKLLLVNRSTVHRFHAF